jgi:trans-2,3-dihydro-3-hydroxyanthranilate isomerase
MLLTGLPALLYGRVLRQAREFYFMKPTRRSFLQLGTFGLATALGRISTAQEDAAKSSTRQFPFVQIDVFSSKRLQGNPLAVFPDARGLSDSEMQDLARETRLEETTFVIPREAAIERDHGVKVRIFTRERELPFAGHPTLGTAVVLRNRLVRERAAAPVAQIVLDLKVGRVPVAFRDDQSGAVFGEMQQVEPVFGQVHQRETVAAILGIRPEDISDEGPIQTVSTGLAFVIVPLRSLRTLQSLSPDFKKAEAYIGGSTEVNDFFYITRDTQDASIDLRARGLWATGEDPATGSAAGCVAAWMVRNGVAESGKIVHIEQGVEIKRPSQIFVRAEKQGDRVLNVRVGGHAVEVMQGEYSI